MLAGWATDPVNMFVTYVLASALLFGSVLGQRCSTSWGIQHTSYLIENLKVDFGGLGRAIRWGMTKGTKLTVGYLFAYCRTTHHQNAAAVPTWVNNLKNLPDFSLCSQPECSCCAFSLAGDQLLVPPHPICKYSRERSQDMAYALEKKKKNTVYLTF